MRMFLFDVEWEKTKALPLQIKMKIFDSKQTIFWGVVVEIINNVQMIEVYLKTLQQLKMQLELSPSFSDNIFK